VQGGDGESEKLPVLSELDGERLFQLASYDVMGLQGGDNNRPWIQTRISASVSP